MKQRNEERGTTEERGTKALEEFLKKQGHTVEKSDNKTFDLKVDGRYAEVKTRAKPYAKFDFISLTDKQFDKIPKEDFLIFLVCNVESPEQIQINQFSSLELRQVTPKRYSSYEYNKGVLDKIIKNRT
jgi:hypothetical protein